MERYSKILNKTKREIVLLKSRPCAWGKCTFCDYIEDNSREPEEMIPLNREILSRVTGEFGVLEVINSGSCFELPTETLELIKEIIKEKKIKKLFLESHWMYRYKTRKMREFMGIPVIFKIGVESFDREFREDFLNKNGDFKTIEELEEYFDSPCIMVGIEGQTEEMIDRDIKILRENFSHGTVNVFTNNSTEIKRDEKLVQWFMDKYNNLIEDPNFDILYDKTDFGVGD